MTLSLMASRFKSFCLSSSLSLNSSLTTLFELSVFTRLSSLLYYIMYSDTVATSSFESNSLGSALLVIPLISYPFSSLLIRFYNLLMSPLLFPLRLPSFCLYVRYLSCMRSNVSSLDSSANRLSVYSRTSLIRY